jgi:hypothetical protein
MGKVDDSLWVRLKPFNARKGHVLQRFAIGDVRFDVERGWYKVGRKLADYLKTVHSRPDDPDSPLAFEVVTAEEAKHLEKAERKAAQLRAIAVDPNVITLANPTDLTSAKLKSVGSGADPLDALEDEEPTPTPPTRKRRLAKAREAQT